MNSSPVVATNFCSLMEAAATVAESIDWAQETKNFHFARWNASDSFPAEAISAVIRGSAGRRALSRLRLLSRASLWAAGFPDDATECSRAVWITHSDPTGASEGDTISPAVYTKQGPLQPPVQTLGFGFEAVVRGSQSNFTAMYASVMIVTLSAWML